MRPSNGTHRQQARLRPENFPRSSSNFPHSQTNVDMRTQKDTLPKTNAERVA